MRLFIVFFLVVLAAGAAAFASYEGSPVRQWLETRAAAKKSETPEVLYLAPFVEIPENYVPPQSSEELENRLPINRIPLEDQHRSADEIGEWLMVVIAESFAFDSRDFGKNINEVSRYYIPAAYDQYTAFLEQAGFKDVIEKNDLRLHSFVQDAPFLLNKGSLEGRYRWLFEVPVMLSYLERRAKGYAGKEPSNRQIVITVQIGRYSDAGKDGILVESFAARTK